MKSTTNPQEEYKTSWNLLFCKIHTIIWYESQLTGVPGNSNDLTGLEDIIINYIIIYININIYIYYNNYIYHCI